MEILKYFQNNLDENLHKHTEEELHIKELDKVISDMPHGKLPGVDVSQSNFIKNFGKTLEMYFILL